MSKDFDLNALHAALDDRRVALGLGWADVGGALGITAGTLRGLRALRFDARALYEALEAERVARGLTWRVVAAEMGVASPATLTRMRAGGRLMFPAVMRVLAWLGAPSARFVRVSGDQPISSVTR